MRRISAGARLALLFLLSISLFFLQGCAKTILQSSPADDLESRSTLAAFTRYGELYSSGCAAGLDAEAEAVVSVSGWLRHQQGKLSGYLQAMEPGYLKFTAINPLGQPVLLFLSSGREFKFLNVLEGRAYLGSVDSEAFDRYRPPGLEMEASYYLLTGRVVPGTAVTEVLRDRGQTGYWLRLHSGTRGLDHLVLFDPAEFVVRRQLILDEQGAPLLDIAYENFQPEISAAKGTDGDGPAGREICKVPARISIGANSGLEKKIDLSLYSFISGAGLTPADFDLEIPANLEKRLVK